MKPTTTAAYCGSARDGWRGCGSRRTLCCSWIDCTSGKRRLCGIRAWRLAFGEFAGALGGALDGLDEGDAQAAFFELEDAVDGAAGGGGDFVLEQGGVGAGFEHHLGGAVGGLGGEQGGDVAGQADVDAGFGEGFDDDVEEGGAGAGEAGDGVHVFLVDDDGAADGGEDALGEGELLGR